MSLEQAINENTSALRALLAHFQAGATLSNPVSVVGADGQPVNLTSAKFAEATPARGPAETKVDTAAEQKPAVTEVGYDQVSKAILAVNKDLGREATLKMLADVQEGAKKGPDIKQENWGKLVSHANALLAAKKGAA